MRPIVVALPLLAVVSLIGCSGNAELDKSRAEAEAAKAESAKTRAELAKVKAELDQLKAQVAAQKSKSKPAAAAGSAVPNAVLVFLKDVRAGRLRSAYQDSMSVAYRKRMDRTAFEQFIAKHLVFRYGNFVPAALGGPEPFKVKKVKDNVYECDCASVNMGNVILRLVQEDGTWRIDDFVELSGMKP